MGHTLRLCSQCERQCSWYTQPQPPKLSMHGETCVPVLPHWLPVGHGSGGAKGRQPWRGAGGCERQEGGRGGRGDRRENGGGGNGRWGDARGGRREAGGERRGGAGGRWAGGGEESTVASDRGADGGRRARATRAHFWTSRHRQIGHTPAGCALVHGEVGGVCRSRLLVPCVVDSTRPVSSALGGSPGRFTPPMREQMPRPETNPPPVQVQCARRPTRVGG